MVPLPQDDISLSLERLAHSTGGESFFLAEPLAYGREADLSTYVSLVDALREIQARTTGDGPYLVSTYTTKMVNIRIPVALQDSV